MDRFSKDKQRRFIRVVLHLENGLRVYGIYQRELLDVTAAIEARRERILRWRTELKPENLARRRFGRFLAFNSKTEFIRKTRAAIRRSEEKITKLEAIGRRIAKRVTTPKPRTVRRARTTRRPSTNNHQHPPSAVAVAVADAGFDGRGLAPPCG